MLADQLSRVDNGSEIEQGVRRMPGDVVHLDNIRITYKSCWPLSAGWTGDRDKLKL